MRVFYSRLLVALFILWFLGGNEGLRAGARDCTDVLAQYFAHRNVPTRLGRSHHLPLLATLSSSFTGSSTSALYRPEFRIDTNEHDRAFVVRGQFIAESFLGAMPVPNVLILPAFDDEKPTQVQFQLNRDFADGLEDLNILTRTLEYLFQVSESYDEFRFVVDEPSVLKKLNDAVREHFERVAFRELEIRNLKQNQTIEDLKLKAFEHGLAIGVAQADFANIANLVEYSDLETEIQSILSASPYGRAILSSGTWNLRVMHRSKGIVFEQDAEDVPATLFHWVISLRPAF